MRIGEADLVSPALLVIDENPGITTSELIEKMEEIFRPQGEDAEILGGRSDTKFSQMVRNLVSHRTLERNDLVTFKESEDRQSGGMFSLTASGQTALEEKRDELQALLANGFPYEDTVRAVKEISKDKGRKKYVDENILIKEGERKKSHTTTYERSLDLRIAAIEHYRNKDGGISCVVCGFDFQKKYGDLGKDFIEIHHEQPLFLYEGEKPDVFLKEAVNTVKPLCSNCHRMIHLGPRKKLMSVNELRARLVLISWRN